MTRATITHWPRAGTFGFAQTDNGERVFVHEKHLPEDVQLATRLPLLGRRIEFDMVEGHAGASSKWMAINVRLVDESDERTATDVTAPRVTPSAEELPRGVAIALGLIDEPKSKRTKRDRLGA